MGKVVTGKGLNEFIASGAHETIKSEPRKTVAQDAPALEVKDEKPIVDIGEKKPEVVEDIYSEEDQETKEEITKAKRFDALMRKKHRAMKEAQERAAEDERLAESQFNRARLAEQKLAEYEKELAQLKKTPTLEHKIEKPDPAKYTDDKGQFKAFEYAEDLAAYSANKAVADDRATQEKARRETEFEATRQVFEGRIAKTVLKHPDYHEVMQAADVQTHTALLEYLTAAEHVGEVNYYLATHPEYVERINKLHPLKAIAEIGKLELTFETPAKVEPEPVPKAVVSGAPAPITPLQTSASVNSNTDPAKMNFRELRAYERSRRKR